MFRRKFIVTYLLTKSVWDGHTRLLLTLVLLGWGSGYVYIVYICVCVCTYMDTSKGSRPHQKTSQEKNCSCVSLSQYPFTEDDYILSLQIFFCSMHDIFISLKTATRKHHRRQIACALFFNRGSFPIRLWKRVTSWAFRYSSSSSVWKQRPHISACESDRSQTVQVGWIRCTGQQFSSEVSPPSVFDCFKH